jgi:glycosyltransferase involved in cell wall biosynthesis
MARLRVLHLIWRLSRGGGKPRVARDLLSRVDRERFDVHVSSVRPFYEKDGIDELGSGLTFHTLGIEGPASVIDEYRISRGVANLARRVRPDVVHMHNSDAIYAAMPWFPNAHIKGKIIEIHDAPQIRRRGRMGAALYGWLAKRRAYTLLVHSSAVRDDLATACRIPANDIALVPLGIDTSRYVRATTPRAEWRHRHGIPEGAPVAAYVARLVAIKNLPLFVEVARSVLAILPAAYFLVSGDGPMRDALQAMIDSYGLGSHVRLLGFQEDLADVYHSADVFLSTSNYEGFGLAIVEAMAAGLPVVSTRVGGVVDPIQEEQTGRLCPAGDREALTASTLELLRDPALRHRMGEAGRARAANVFDVKVMVKQFEDLYVATVGGEGRASTVASGAA